MKRFISLVLALLLTLSLVVTASAAESDTPMQQRLAVGEYFTMVVKDDGSLWFWGEGNPQNLTILDDGSIGYEENPTSLSIPINTTEPIKLMDDVVSVCASTTYAAAIKEDGSLWEWCGEKEPVKVLDDVVQVSCSVTHSAAVQSDGSLWTWGDNGCGQLGDGTITGSHTPIKVMENVAYVSCGTRYTAAIKTDGSLWTWGENDEGQLGNDGLCNNELYTPEKDFSEIVIASNSATGEINTSYQDWVFLTTPTKIMDDVTAISCGAAAMAAIRSDGSLWTWGNNDVGQLGIGRVTESSLVPIKVFDYGVSYVNIGASTVAIIRTDNSLWIWGNGGTCGLLGNGIIERSAVVPVKVMDNVAAVRTGWHHVAATKNDGSVWLWGDNLNEHLGFPDSNATHLGFFRDTRPCQTTPLMLKDFNIKETSSEQDDLTGVSSWAKEEVSAAQPAGLVPVLTGKPDYQDAITREQFAELVWNFASLYYYGAMIPMTDFTDCDNFHVLCASEAGIVNGVGDGKFAPKQTATREEIATMLRRAIRFIERTQSTRVNPIPLAGSIEGYSDKNAVSSWAVEGVGALAANGIMKGTSETTLSPKAPCTVEQCIILIYRLYMEYETN